MNRPLRIYYCPMHGVDVTKVHRCEASDGTIYPMAYVAERQAGEPVPPPKPPDSRQAAEARWPGRRT